MNLSPTTFQVFGLFSLNRFDFIFLLCDSDNELQLNPTTSSLL